MITVSYLNKEWQARQMFYKDTWLAEIWYDLKQILDNGAKNIMVYDKS